MEDVFVLSAVRTPIGGRGLTPMTRLAGYAHALVTMCIGGGQGIAAIFQRA